MLYFIITLLIVFFSTSYVYLNCKIDALINPVFYLILFQLISLLGTIYLLDFSLESDIVYFFLNILGFLSYLAGFSVGSYIYPVSKIAKEQWRTEPFLIESSVIYTFQIKALIVISSVICIVYFYAVGYNVFLLGATELFSTGTVTKDISALRLASYNSKVTGEYYYPGYVNQFKDTLLPLSIFYLWGRYSLLPANFNTFSSKLFLWVFTIISLVSILGTGQRGAFVLVLIMGGAFILTILQEEKRRSVSLIGGSIMLTFFLVSTFINGRTGSSEFTLSGVLEATWQRISSDNQFSALIGFREIIYKMPMQWGDEWLQALYGLSPGHSGSNLANDIGQFIYGGYGTSPPSSIGSIYYNFGWLGIIIFPFIFSIFIKYYYYRFYTKPKFLLRILIYISGFILMGTWLAGSPIEYFFNAGLIALIILKLIINFIQQPFHKWIPSSKN